MFKFDFSSLSYLCSQVEAKKAVPRDDQNIMSRSTSSIHGSPSPGPTRKIFVGGLTSTVTESDFKKYFDQFGNIIDVVVMYDHNTQRPRGFGFITYDSEEAVDKVLLKNFHELNGKMVEVKRAVPRELSPGPSRSPLGGYNYGLNRVNNFFNGYTLGYAPSSVGGYGLGMDGKFSAVAGGRSGFSPFGASYGISMNFEPGLNLNFGNGANFSGNMSYGQGLNPYYNGNTNGLDSPIGHDRSSGGQGGRDNISGNSVNFGNGNGDNNFGLGTAGYERNIGTNVVPASSYTASNGGYDASFANLSASASIYGDTTWQSSTSVRDSSGTFGYGLDSATSDVMRKSSPGFIGGYNVNKRQANRGIAT
ncbi:hypothetical protein V6Z11_A08G059800 [Gossypium hirsutum]